MKRVGWLWMLFVILIATIPIVARADFGTVCNGMTCTDTRACGNCGYQQQFLDTSTCTCQWSSLCQEQGVCAPQSTQPGSCQTNYQQVCTSTCTWPSACTCIPGVTTQACPANASFIQTCQSPAGTNTWGTCTFNCYATNACPAKECNTYSSCSATPYPTNGCVYTPVSRGEQCSGGKYCDSNGACTLLACSGSALLCASTQPANTNPALGDSNSYLCNAGQSCYPCKPGFIVHNGACVSTTSCGDVPGHFCATLSNPSGVGAVADPNYVCTSNTCYQCSDPTKVWNGQACVAACTPSCPSPSTVTCNQQIMPTNGCGTCTGTGTLCSTGSTCTTTGCVCTPSSCSYGSTCSTTGTDNCGTQNSPFCNRATNGNTCTPVPGQTGACTNGQCVCTPTCNWPADACVSSVPNGCGGTCNRAVEGVACAQSSVCSGSTCTSYAVQLLNSTNGIIDPARIISGETVAVHMNLAPSRTDVHYSVVGYGMNYADTTTFSFTPGAIGTSGSITVTARTNAATITSTTLSFTVICLPGHACYCNDYCLNSASHVITRPGNTCSPNQVCGVCDSSTVIDPATMTCVPPPACTPNQPCAPILAAGATTTGTIDCHTVTYHYNTTTPQSCVSGSCVPQAQGTPFMVVEANVTVANGTACGGENVCLSGVCKTPQCSATRPCTDECFPTCSSSTFTCLPFVGNVCDDVSEGGLLLREANISACVTSTATVYVCNQPCTLANPEDQMCTGNVSGICKGSSCITACPDNIYPGCSPEAGQYYTALTDYACEGADTCYSCIDGSYWNGSDCKASQYRLDFAVPIATMGEDFTLTPSLYSSASEEPIPNTNNQFRFELSRPGAPPMYSTASFTLRLDEVGTIPITITASGLSGTVAQATRQLTAVCGSNVACCPAGSNAFSPDGTACSVGGIPGVCSNHACSLSCTPRGPEVCNNAIDDNCDGYTDCYDSACSSFCGDLRCGQGQIICSNACVDVQKDNLNCGSCGNTCGNTEQCKGGVCKAIDNCQIVCNTDRDCAKGTVCINPGDCTKSFCAPANIIKQNDTTADGITREILKERTFSVTKELRGKQLRLVIKNLAPVSLRNFTLTVNLNLPKEVVASASDLSSDHSFTVIKDDPVIAFNFAQLNARQEILIELPNSVDPSLSSSIYVTGTHNNVTESAKYLTDSDLTLTSNLVRENGKSKLLLGIDPHSQLSGVRVPVQIPKCVAAHASELKLSGDYEIVKDDPLVVWTFDSLSSKQTIEIGVDRDVSESCKNDLTAFAVADGIDRPINPWIPLLIIPILGVLIIFFQRFHAGEVEERLGKREFIALAKQQGASDEQAEQQWREYEQKF